VWEKNAFGERIFGKCEGGRQRKLLVTIKVVIAEMHVGSEDDQWVKMT
jgi:hypothetical protein